VNIYHYSHAISLLPQIQPNVGSCRKPSFDSCRISYRRSSPIKPQEKRPLNLDLSLSSKDPSANFSRRISVFARHRLTRYQSCKSQTASEAGNPGITQTSVESIEQRSGELQSSLWSGVSSMIGIAIAAKLNKEIAHDKYPSLSNLLLSHCGDTHITQQ
jgi:hypothetical protein